MQSVLRSSHIAATAGRNTSITSAILLITLQGRLAPFLLKLLQAELEHEAKPNLIRRRRDPDVRDTCGELLYFIILCIKLIIVRLLLDLVVFRRMDVSVLWVGSMQRVLMLLA
jgi:hypothetical protein